MKQTLQMDYEPEQVVDISTLSREQWLAFRRLGIGGSDVARYHGNLAFCYQPVILLLLTRSDVTRCHLTEPEANWVAKEFGHRLEDLVAEIFSKKTGLEVFPVRIMFRHPLYPFMLADIDFLCVCRMAALPYWSAKPVIITPKRSGMTGKSRSTMSIRCGTICRW